jgi:O-acetyl-ADP-ribose deacetylase (regulator of RNase III)
MAPVEFRLILVDPIPELCQAFRDEFGDLSTVEIVHGRFEELEHFDCMVSPANSFGLMDGGVDRAIINFFGIELMARVQEKIIREFRGEQPVGTSFIVETGHPKHRFLAHTPTMRVPMQIACTDNVYRATQAMLLAVWRHNLDHRDPIRVVACPGLGTATGAVPVRRAARQMALAYRNFLDPPEAISWPFASRRQAAIGLGGDDGFRVARGSHNDT